MHKQPFFKEWFTLAEIAQFLQKQHGGSNSRLELLQRLYASNLAEFYIYLSGSNSAAPLTLGTQQTTAAAITLGEYSPIPDYSGSYQQLHDFAKIHSDTLIIQGEHTQICFAFHPESQQCHLVSFSGLFALPLAMFDEQSVLLSDGTSLYLPETAFYPTFDLVENPAQPSSYYNFGFLMMQFRHAYGQGKINLDDIKIYLPAYAMQDFIAYFDPNQTPNQPENSQEVVKNKSKKTPKNGKDFYNQAILDSIKHTAEANPTAGGYTIVNSVIKAFCDKYRLKAERDLYTARHYLQAAKTQYQIIFPDRRGRQKVEISVILAS